VTFVGASDPSSAEVAAGLQYRFDFNNDGNFTALQSSNTITIPQQYLLQSGAVTIHGQVVNSDGGTVDGYTIITVNEVPPTFVVSGASTSNEGATYTFNLTATEPPGDVIKTWDVDWGDKTTTAATSRAARLSRC
jgi:hypothetical protein